MGIPNNPSILLLLLIIIISTYLETFVETNSLHFRRSTNHLPKFSTNLKTLAETNLVHFQLLNSTIDNRSISLQRFSFSSVPTVNFQSQCNPASFLASCSLAAV